MPLLIFFLIYTATTAIYTLSLHDALPISTSTTAPMTCATRPTRLLGCADALGLPVAAGLGAAFLRDLVGARSEEHTSELQSRENIVCRLLLEKKKATWKSQVLHPNVGSLF